MSRYEPRFRFTLADLVCVVFGAAISLVAYPLVTDGVIELWYAGIDFLKFSAKVLFGGGLCLVACYAVGCRGRLVVATIVSVAVFLVAGEPAWIGLLLAWSAVLVFRYDAPKVRLVVLCVAATVILAHRQGYKLYGSAVLYDNRPVLIKSHSLESVMPPNTLVADDGTRFEVRGVVFTKEFLQLPRDEMLRVFEYDPNNSDARVRVAKSDVHTPCGVAFERRGEYGCGNTFFPTFFPRRLPWFFAEDVAWHLLDRNLATKN